MTTDFNIQQFQKNIEEFINYLNSETGKKHLDMKSQFKVISYHKSTQEITLPGDTHLITIIYAFKRVTLSEDEDYFAALDAIAFKAYELINGFIISDEGTPYYIFGPKSYDHTIWYDQNNNDQISLNAADESLIFQIYFSGQN